MSDENANDCREEYPVRIVPGAVYRHVAGGHYHALCVAKCVRSGQELAVYKGIRGQDRGKYLASPLIDFVANFTPIVEQQPEPTPEKVVTTKEGPWY